MDIEIYGQIFELIGLIILLNAERNKKYFSSMRKPTPYYSNHKISVLCIAFGYFLKFCASWFKS
jgi:hypothetical protein